MISKIIKAEFTMLLGEIKQYYLNYIFYNLSILILYFGLFYNFFKDSSSETILSALICLVLWQICSNSLQYLCYVIQDEAMMGTLEQIFLTKTSFISILLAKSLVNMMFVLFKGLISFILCVVLFGKIEILAILDVFDVALIFLIFIVTTFAFYCLGAIFGGLSLYFKRVSSLLNVFDYFLLLFTGVISTIDSYPVVFQSLLKLIPITQANNLIYAVCAGQVEIGSFILFSVLIVVCVAISNAVLVLLLNRAKANGKLGQY